MDNKKYIARSGQALEAHLFGAAAKAKRFAAKIGLAEQGELIGLLHDFGKYSCQFQKYIYTAVGLLDPDLDEDYVDAKALKGKIDHSTAGAQWIWNALKSKGSTGQLCAQILALCIVSHHSGLIDCLNPSGENIFNKRMLKPDVDTHFLECVESAESNILEKAQALIARPILIEMQKQLSHIMRREQQSPHLSESIKVFYLGLIVRFLFSSLIDADRLDSAGKEVLTHPVPWSVAIERLEKKLASLPSEEEIDHLRRQISDHCRDKATQAQGIYTLTVPTGGGKTYASLRYALHHARQHNLERIIYIIPYTSIIEQNADAIRNVIEDKADASPWVLEHHSNLEPEKQTWQSKLAAENWDAPIVLTTMVQFLEAALGGGTRGPRRFHQLANSVLIFDEIQALPIQCTHLFCNTLNFLVEHAKTTALLCTATQPLLNELKVPDKGQLVIPKENELMPDVKQLFEKLERVEIINKCKAGGWTAKEIADLAMTEFKDRGNCLVIVNTKKYAQKLYQLCEKFLPKEVLFHLSTNQCAAHRKTIFAAVRARLAQNLPVLCISTQLIEAGVDIDFAGVIRFLAGLDSIAQAAGRCNRHGTLRDKMGNLIKGRVYVLNPADENIDSLPDIKCGREKARRVLDELQAGSVLSPEKIKRYFQYYFFERAGVMAYPVNKETGYDTSLFDLLSENSTNGGFKKCEEGKSPILQQSFMTAGRAFQSIKAPTQAVIVPYGEGKNLIAELGRIANNFDPKTYYAYLRKAQRYSVNVFPGMWEILLKKGIVREIQRGEGVFCLDECYYSEEFGLSVERVRDMAPQIV